MNQNINTLIQLMKIKEGKMFVYNLYDENDVELQPLNLSKMPAQSS